MIAGAASPPVRTNNAPPPMVAPAIFHHRPFDCLFALLHNSNTSKRNHARTAQTRGKVSEHRWVSRTAVVRAGKWGVGVRVSVGCE
jgi:hypothetical protein